MKLQLKQISKKIKKPWIPQEVAVVDGHHAYLCMFKGDFVTHRHPGDEASFFAWTETLKSKPRTASSR